jgi:hypothetical protein
VDANYFGGGFGVAAYLHIAELIQNHQRIATGWIKLSCIPIILLPAIQALFVKEARFHRNFSIGSSVIVVLLLGCNIHHQGRKNQKRQMKNH